MARGRRSGRFSRFLPGDPRVEQPYLLTPQTALRVAVLGGIALVAFAVLILRLWSLQILSGSDYSAQASNNQRREIAIDAPRGPILDRRGRALVSNTVSTAAYLWPHDLPKGTGRDTEIRQLARVLVVPEAEILQKIDELGADPVTPLLLKVSLNQDQINYIYEHSAMFRGVQLRQKYLRKYRWRVAAAQLLGHVGDVTQAQLDGHPKEYEPGDSVGQAGVEATYDKYLRGTPGTAELLVDSLGRPRSDVIVRNAPQPGQAVRLTIDADLQRAASEAIRVGLTAARNNGNGWANGGALLALDPNTGEVLAMASNPTYRPGLFVGRQDPKALKPLLDEQAAYEANYPGMNRVIAATYPPGSVFKPVTAIAALQQGLIRPNETLPCTPLYTVRGSTGADQTFKNWDPYVDAQLDLPRALAQSCDTVFYQLGFDFYGLPSSEGQPLQAWAEKFGFGRSTGIARDVGPEATGRVPTIEWRKKTYKERVDQLWKTGDSIQLAIGQKDVTVTVMQMARFYALLANGGRLVTPYLVSDVERPGPKGAPAIVEQTFPPAQAPRPAGVEPSYLELVRNGLYQATHETYGTSSGIFNAYPIVKKEKVGGVTVERRIEVAGKTGTAEKITKPPGADRPLLLDQAWWCGYAPADKPQVALCTVIENGGHGGEAAAPAALYFLEKFFRPNAKPTEFSGPVNSD